MPLDTGYVRGVSSLSPMFHGGNPAKGPMDSAPNRVQRAFCLSCVRGHSNRFLYSTGPQRRNRWRALAPQDFATPGIDRVRQECATTGLQIPLERQYGDLTLASAHSCTMAFDIVAPQFLQIDALRAEYQNPRMGCSEFEWK